jgi:glycosyltransferase involved in cell wall biosynthesis
MQTLNILHTISVRWWNACAYYAVIIAKGQQHLNHYVQLYSDKDSPPYNHSIENNLNTKAFNFASLQPFNFIRNYFAIKSKIKKENIQIVNCHRPEDHLIMGIVCNHMRIPLVRTVGDIRPPAENFFNKWLHLKATDYFIFTSESNRTRFVSVWPEIMEKSRIIFGGLDLDLFKPQEKSEKLLKQLNVDPKIKIVGYIGRLSNTKDIPTFVRAISLIKHALPEVQFLISGKEFSVSRDDIIKLANTLNLTDSLLFLDRHDPVQEVISLIDVGIISSNDSEAISRVGMEYLSLGKPVVATDVNVLPEIIENDVNGFITNTEDPHTMAEAVIKLLTDENLYKMISKNNIESSRKKFNYIKESEKTLAIYNSLIEKEKNKYQKNKL